MLWCFNTMLITSDHSDVYHYVGTPTNQHYTSLLSKSTMSYTISARGASGRYMPETTENERFWASLCAKNRKRPPKWAPKITENDPPWHISSKGIFGGPATCCNLTVLLPGICCIAIDSRLKRRFQHEFGAFAVNVNTALERLAWCRE